MTSNRITIALLLAMAAAHSLAQGPADPTRPPSPAEIQAWFSEVAPAGNGPGYRLQAILLGTGRRIAIVDGQRLQEGDRIDEARVESIEAGRVVLDRSGDRLELRITTHLDKND